MEKLNKQAVIDAVAEELGLTKKSTKEVVDATFSTIVNMLAEGNTVAINGLGSFTVKETAARTGVNPQDPTQKIEIAASKRVAFKAASGLKESVKATA